MAREDGANDASPSRMPVLAAPRLFVCYLVLVEAATLGWIGVLLTRPGFGAAQWWIVGIFLLLAIGFEEASTRTARLRLRIGSDLKHELTSVWSFAAAVTLPSLLAALVIGGILTYTWLRQERPAGEQLYRMVFNTANVLLSAVAANAVFRAGSSAWSGMVWGLGTALALGAALITYAAVNRLLVTGALANLGVRGNDLLGTRDDNLTELATLCLGALVALAVQYQPILAVLVLFPLIALQRGAVVGQLERAASTDPKTGLLNAVAWEQVAQRELTRAGRTGGSLAVLMIDIDRFKPVNDRYGHIAGDRVLKAVGRCLSADVRDYDTVGRFGGEEFVAVLPDANDLTAMAIAERLRARVEAFTMASVVEDPAPPMDALTVSIGVARLPIDGQELSDLLHAADRALYQAKALGRNRVQLADRGGDLPDFVDAP